jgi:hypothetical protein
MPPADSKVPAGFRALRATLTAGALYDFVFAILFVAAPGGVARLLALPLPGERFYLWILAVLLGIVGATYLVAARDPRRFRPLVVVAIAGRAAGFVAFAAAALSTPGLEGLWVVGGADLAFSLAHLATCRGLFA